MTSIDAGEILRNMKLKAEGSIFEQEGVWHYKVSLFVKGPDLATEFMSLPCKSLAAAFGSLTDDFGAQVQELVVKMGEM